MHNLRGLVFYFACSIIIFVAACSQKPAKTTEVKHYPVDSMEGIITIADLQSLININIGESLFIAEDIMQEVKHIITPEKTLNDAYKMMNNYNIEYIPVVSDKEKRKMYGLITSSQIKEVLRKETILLQKYII